MNKDAFVFPGRARRTRSKAAVGLVVALVMISPAPGCSFLKAGPDTSRYFVLSSTANSTDAAPARTRSDVHFGLGPVKLPGYLDTQGIVRTGRGGSIDYVPGAFWAEPVSNAFARALLYRTEARVGTAHGVAYPWYATTQVDWKVPVDVLRFEATSDGRAMLIARWSVERVSDGAVVAGTESVFEEPAGADPAVIVDALSRCIDRLAEAIAAAVTGPTAVAAPAAKTAGKSASAARAPAAAPKDNRPGASTAAPKTGSNNAPASPPTGGSGAASGRK